MVLTYHEGAFDWLSLPSAKSQLRDFPGLQPLSVML